MMITEITIISSSRVNPRDVMPRLRLATPDAAADSVPFIALGCQSPVTVFLSVERFELVVLRFGKAHIEDVLAAPRIRSRVVVAGAKLPVLFAGDRVNGNVAEIALGLGR